MQRIVTAFISTALATTLAAACGSKATDVQEPQTAASTPDDPPGGGDEASLTTDEMRTCETADDCVAVACACKCSGCGGFYYEDVVNSASEQAWYEQHGCTRAEVCPMQCCPAKTTLACKDGNCVVEVEAATIAETPQTLD